MKLELYDKERKKGDIRDDVDIILIMGGIIFGLVVVFTIVEKVFG